MANRIRILKRALPALVLLAALGAFYALGLHRALSWQALAERQDLLLRWVADRPLATACGYVAAYAAAVAVSLPGAVVLTIAGGLLFGPVLGAALAVAGATLGAVLVFLAARSALGPLLTGSLMTGRLRPLLDRMRPGMERDGFSYVLAVRLLPVVPFWLINLAAAVAGVRLLPYAAATLLGIAPATAVFASVGAGIGSVLAAGGRPDLSIVFTAPVLLPLLGLAALALLPVAWRAWKRTRV